jgi:phospholipase C
LIIIGLGEFKLNNYFWSTDLYSLTPLLKNSEIKLTQIVVDFSEVFGFFSKILVPIKNSSNDQ